MSLERRTNISQADLEASNKMPIYVASAVGLGLATASVVLRGIARQKSKAVFGWDDYTIVLALILLYALDTSTILATAKYGLGRHFFAVPYVIVSFLKDSLANLVLWLATAAATKASLLLLYYRLFSPSPRFRLAIYIASIAVFSQWFSITLVTVFQCRPVAAFWNKTISGAECVNISHFTVASGIMNLLTDILILCLPIRMVWGLHTTNTQKITLTGIFLLGSFVCAISIIRINKVAHLDGDDVTWHSVNVWVWTILEDSVGIMSACLPTMRPLIGNVRSGASDAKPSDRKRSQSSSQHAKGGPFVRLSEQPSVELSTLEDQKEGYGVAGTRHDMNQRQETV